MPGNYKFRKRKPGRIASFNLVLPNSSIIFFGLAFILLILTMIEPVEIPSSRNQQFQTAKSTTILANISSATDIISGSFTDPGNNLSTINSFLSKQNESSCDAVYDPSLMQRAISLIPQIAERVKGLSKSEQYKLCINKVRSAKTGLNRQL